MALIFASNQELQLPSHAELPEKERPTYVFRPATVKEAREELERSARWDNMQYDEVFSEALDDIKNRMQCVRVDGKNCTKLLKIEDTLTEEQVIELHTNMKLMSSSLQMLHKKKSKLLSSFDTEGSAEGADLDESANS